jgi:membrane protease YdiL (CAAX protease family)
MKNLSELLIIIGLFILCAALGQAFVLLTLSVWYGVNADGDTLKQLLDIQKLLQHSEGVWILYYMQGVVALFSMVLSSWVFQRYFATEKKPFNTQALQVMQVSLVVLLMLAVIPLVSSMVWWNNQVRLPDFLSEFEKMARDKENSTGIMMGVLTRFPTFVHFLVAIVVIAIVPAVGEELWFRGVFQRKMQDMVSPHVAIWATGFIFSLVHFQFFGFFPRWLLGVLFGYLYWWSGNLWITIIAHFVNNFVTLLAIYLYNQKIIGYNFYEPAPVAWYAVLLSAIVTTILVYSFKQQSKIIDTNGN